MVKFLVFEQRAERRTADLDRLGCHSGLDRGGARLVHQKCHLTDIVAGLHIGDWHFLAADLYRHDGVALADQVDRIVLGVALLDQRVVGSEFLDRRAGDNIGKQPVVDVGRQIRLDLANDRSAVDRLLHRGFRADQLDHRVAVDLEQQRGLGRNNRGGAPAPGN